MGRWNTAFTIRLVYALCLSGATLNHARSVLEHGLAWDYGGVPPFVSAFWTALTFIDALAVLLLFARPRAGLLLTVAIMVADVAVNGWVGMTYGFDVAAFSAQFVFMLFVLGTVRMAWRLESVRRRHAGQ
ncbi:hypothetical protein CD932_23070 [Janthinobacterium sp. PC23-8]|nr:hypothetical protein CD932_23070 [Janthinobacterium sp. PC23-8]